MYSLRLYEPVLVGSGFVADLTRKTQDWQRTVRLQGGAWDGSFTLSGDPSELLRAFQSWLGYHVVESIGGASTWEGLVWGLELTWGGLVRRRSYETINNYLTARYTDESGTQQTTAAASAAASVARYGRKDGLLLLDGYPAALVEGRRDTELGMLAWPTATTLGQGQIGAPVLRVEVVGYAFTANFRYVSSADGATGNVNDWVSAIVAADCEFLSSGAIDTNALQKARTLTMPRRAWDCLAELAALGDASYRPWRLWVDTGRRLYYRAVDLTPLYYRRNGQYYTALGGAPVSPWAMRPGVVRDNDYPVRTAERGSTFDDARDFLIDELSVDAAGAVSLRTAQYTEAEYMDAQAKAEKAGGNV